jgi:hypothetical protein
MTGLTGRPLDLFEEPVARVWHLCDTRENPGIRRDVLVVFNWQEKGVANITVNLDRLQIPDARGEYVGFDFWANIFLDDLPTNFSTELPAGSCQVIAILPRADHPIVVSTSRHVTQGMVDVLREDWQEGMLSGESAVVKDDPYELRILVPAGFQINAALFQMEPGNTQIHPIVQVGELDARVQFIPPASGKVTWQIQFA